MDRGPGALQQSSNGGFVMVTLAQLGANYLARDHAGTLAVVSDAATPYLVFADSISSTTGWRKADGTLVTSDPLLDQYVWSPSNTSSQLVLTNGNRSVAWAASGFGASGTRGYTGKSSGKYAWEIVADLSTSDSLQSGISNAAFDASIANQQFTIMGSPNAIGWGGTSIKYNGTTVTAMPTIATGDVIQHALDLDAKLMWWRKAGGLWNNSATANPTTGVGGIDVSGVLTGTVYPALTLYNSANAKATSRFTAAQMSAQVSGFSAFG